MTKEKNKNDDDFLSGCIDEVPECCGVDMLYALSIQTLMRNKYNPVTGKVEVMSNTSFNVEKTFKKDKKVDWLSTICITASYQKEEMKRLEKSGFEKLKAFRSRSTGRYLTIWLKR